ncbi:hydantoinase/oxoprolinase family protein [Variovorax sp. YR216]|uniref:hydantoinase/oxoprolinase family protein n=1 Tax=Variovorax sp. YR216 TaxID=1882828 RepID=UPI000894E33F|nr:hydantoinase/oxoprolinase family protein [Variovorax sp. YR216]SEA86685.1 N-methylhydantoinase A [Variovorax sp. YR216]
MGYFIGTDVGGTFTDLWVAERGGRARVFKSPTTGDVMTGVINAVHLAAEHFGKDFSAFCSSIERFGHGTTVGLNALLTGNGAKTLVLTTAGFGDTLEIGRMRRQTAGLSELEVGDWMLHDRHGPLVSRDRVVEIVERIDANGQVLLALDEAAARETLQPWASRGVEAVAICTLWATTNPVHEQRLEKLVRELFPSAFVTLSHQISPVVGEYARMATTVANAMLGPIAGRYLSKLESTLREAGMRVPVLMMTSAGGVLPTRVLDDRPAVAIFSGPAAGVMGSIAVGKQRGESNILSVDIGGTSFDVGAIVQGSPMMRQSIDLAGADISVPSIDVASIGAGGGSIASAEFGDMAVGPQSAGANPGPACYGRGGKRPTSTDADLALGVLDPDYFIGGRMRLNKDLAETAIREHVAEPLGLSVRAAAWGIREVLDNKMADLLRRVTIERGHDPRDFVLYANGGAGPSHAWVLARELGLDKFVVPAAATAQSAFGTANSALGFTVTKPFYLRLTGRTEPTPASLDALGNTLYGAVADARAALAQADASDLECGVSIAIRYRGQAHHLDVPLRDLDPNGGFALKDYRGAIESFEQSYEALFGRGAGSRDAGFELLSIRVIGRGLLPVPDMVGEGEPMEEVGKREVVFDDPEQPVLTTIYRTTWPKPGQVINGPCIVEYPGQSVVVPPGAVAEADPRGHLEVRFNAAPV